MPESKWIGTLRAVCVIDAGLPRNRFAEHSHGYLSRDGSSPGEILDAARAQLLAYPTVEMLHGVADHAHETADGFSVRLSDGSEITGRRLVLTFGISDARHPVAVGPLPTVDPARGPPGPRAHLRRHARDGGRGPNPPPIFPRDLNRSNQRNPRYLRSIRVNLRNHSSSP